MSKRYRHRAHHSGRRSWCLGTMIALITLSLIVLAVYILFMRPGLGHYLGQRLGQHLFDPPRTTPEQIEAWIEDGVPDVIAALPSGAVTVTQEQVNQYLAAQLETIHIIDSVTVYFLPGQVQADIQAFGFPGRISADPGIQDGRIVLHNPQINEPLGMMLSAESLAAALERQINAQLVARGQVVQALQVDHGQITLVIE